MYRKLVISGVSVLGLMTLVVSAQQSPNPDQQPSNFVQPGYQPGQNAPLLGLYSSRHPRQEELELAHKSEELVKQLAKAEGDKKEKIKDQLTETLGKQFDARQKRHQAELTALEAQVKKLKELVQKRQENRREIIGKRLDQLMREADGLGW